MDKQKLKSLIEEGYSWDEYLLLVNKSANLHKKRYREVQKKDIFERTGTKPLKALIITEEACGDCAWAIPKIVRLLQHLNDIDLKLYPRREFPELQDNYLTNGKRAVPKLVLLDSKLDVVGQWGPRPAEIQEYVKESIGVIERTEWYPRVLAYYRDKGQDALILELKTIFKTV